MDDLTNQDSATPAHEQQVITCVALIHKSIEGVPHAMLAQRSLDKKFLPGVFELPGGHIDYGEELKIGLARELFEELKIKVSVGAPFSAFTYLNEVKGSHSVEIIYFAKMVNENTPINLDPRDHSSIKWVSMDNIEEIIAVNGTDDPELEHIIYGLELLSGKPPYTG